MIITDQLLIRGFTSGEVPDDAGGVVIFENNTPWLPGDFTDLLVTVDQEGGRINRIREGVTILPPAAEIRTTKEAYKRGQIMAGELLPLGINLNLAPVVDVSNGSGKNVIGNRSFGSDPRRTARLSAAMIRGMQDNGLAACAKHFPGHGATGKNSHQCLPRVRLSLSQWRKNHMPPFKKAIESGVSCIMVGHIMYPVMDKMFPASLSGKIITGILRKKMGFAGVIITDDLGMGAITKHYQPGEAAVMAIEAGADMVMECHSKSRQEMIRKALSRALGEGRITKQRIMESLARIKKLKNFDGV